MTYLSLRWVRGLFLRGEAEEKDDYDHQQDDAENNQADDDRMIHYVLNETGCTGSG